MIVPGLSRARCGFFLIGICGCFFSWPSCLGLVVGWLRSSMFFNGIPILRFLFGCFWCLLCCWGGWLCVLVGGALVGLVALLAVTLGHFVGAQFTEYDQNNLEYRGWVFIAVVVGSFLGFLGHKIRSSRMITRALAASTPATLLCLPLYFWHEDVSYFADYFDPRMAAVDVLSAFLLLLMCRGIVARVVAVLCAPVLFYPLGLSLVITSPLLWYSGGGI